MRRSVVSETVILSTLIVLCLAVISPYFHNGYFPTHDGEWAVVRLGDMYRSVKDFQFPVRYSGHLNFGYGYPLFNFAYPFPYYAGLLFYALNLGLVGSVKALFVTSVFVSAFGMYILAKKMWKSRLAGFVSAVLYIYYPYRMVDLYVRGSLGESLSFAFFPLLIFSVIKIVQKEQVKFYLPFGMVLLAMQITTHNIMSVLFLPLLLCFTFYMEYHHRFVHWKQFVMLFIGGLCLSVFFWFPAIFEKGNILLSKIPIADRSLYFVSSLQLLLPKFGYGVPLETGGFGYYVGIAHILVFVGVGSMLLYQYRKKHVENTVFRLAGFFFCASVFYIIFLFKQTAFVWETVPLIREINYPWTILAPLGFVLSLVGGFIAIVPRFRIIAVLFIPIALISVFSYAKPEYYVDHGDLYYLTNEATTTSSDELMPIWVMQKPTSHFKEKVEIIQGMGTIFDLDAASNRIAFKTNFAVDSTIRVNTIYYPGWQAQYNSMPLSISYKNNMGVMDLSLPAGNQAVVLQFNETPYRLLANAISLLSAIVLVLYIIVSGMRKGKVFLKK